MAMLCLACSGASAQQSYGPPIIDFSPLGNLPDAFTQGREWRQRQDALRAHQNEESARAPRGCPDKPGAPISGCPRTQFPPGVVNAQRNWTRCLATSMPIQQSLTADSNAAAEASLSACQTEEQGVVSTLRAESHLTSSEVGDLMGYLKPQMKRRLLALATQGPAAPNVTNVEGTGQPQTSTCDLRHAIYRTAQVNADSLYFVSSGASGFWDKQMMVSSSKLKNPLRFALWIQNGSGNEYVSTCEALERGTSKYCADTNTIDSELISVNGGRESQGIGRGKEQGISGASAR
jgi:hypothetical protein